MREFATAGAPHLPPEISVRGVMGKVLLALIPGVLAQVWFGGIGVLLQIALAAVFAWSIEAAMLTWLKRPRYQFLTDLSAPLTGALFALCVPAWTPWWIALIAMIAAMVFAKHLYGGLGYNVFNPAIVGYVVVLICFPRELTAWPPRLDGGGELSWLALAQAVFGTGTPWDTMAQATPLDTLHNLAGLGRTITETWREPGLWAMTGLGQHWIVAGYLLGGLWLLQQRVIAWQVPVGMLGTIALIAAIGWLYDADRNASPLLHLCAGASVLGAFFIATDPVSGATTPRGRLLFGAGVGLMTMLIRNFGAYPDGVAFGVLLMNAAAPLLDRYTRPRVFGRP
jgi:Na+-translocating ferredoxin:NAD+ oxidoreductase subunit D